MFIELTTNGKKFIGNVNLLQRVFVDSKGKTGVVGWNNNGYFEVEETYEEVKRLISISTTVLNKEEK